MWAPPILVLMDLVGSIVERWGARIYFFILKIYYSNRSVNVRSLLLYKTTGIIVIGKPVHY
jgi:hypothetical protein